MKVLDWVLRKTNTGIITIEALIFEQPLGVILEEGSLLYTAHFHGKYEAELKYRLSSKTRFSQQLHSIPHEVMLENNVDTDCYFDTPEYTLEKQNKSLCIRSIQPSGIQLWIVKGPSPDRCEANQINDFERAKSMLTSLGFNPVLHLKKTRSIYFIDRYHITLDHLNGLGDFAEFAIMTDDEDQLPTLKKALRLLASLFGLTDEDLVHESYKTMATRQQQNNAIADA